ncbi:hypothetical protein LR010_00550 [Candidatus Gracilibacteria bacterium]|nr:hypothetical protein [Candidatus Gracilibacteria bacterium]
MVDGGVNIESTKEGIYSFQDFKDWFNDAPHQRTVAWGKIDALRERLERSSESNSDPIVFLHDLYFDKTFSIRKILNHELVDKLYSPKGLQQLFVNSFGWNLRKKTDRTPEHALVIDAKIQAGVSKFESQIADLIDGRGKTRIFKMSEFENKDYKIGKALYVLKTLGGIDKSMLLRISAEGLLGARVLANALNKQSRNILDNFPEINISYDDIELKPQSIEKWIAYKENIQSK